MFEAVEELVAAPAPGSKTQGFVDWGDPVLSGWQWPYVAFNGASPGPALLVTGGIHGSEYVSIDAAIRLGAAIDPKTLRGQILCLPVMNPAAFWERAAYVSPVDNLNLNRVFPGKAKGSFTERLAYQLVQKAMRHADAYIDLHGGDVPEALVPFNLYYETGNATIDGKSRAMAEAFGAPACWSTARAAHPLRASPMPPQRPWAFQRCWPKMVERASTTWRRLRACMTGCRTCYAPSI